MDVYIHQDIRAENKVSYELSDEYILPQLKKDCLSITVPNFVGGMAEWMFPMQGAAGEKVISTPENPIYVLYTDSILDELYYKGVCSNLNEYVRYYLDYKFEKEFLKRKFESSIRKIFEREKNWDIKVADYIQKIISRYLSLRIKHILLNI